MEGDPPGPGPGEQALAEFRALVELAGGKPEVLLVGEVLEGEQTPALLGGFARELFGEQPGEAAGEPAAAVPPGGKPAPQVRVCLDPGGAGRAIRGRLLFLLCRPASLRPPRGRARLREIARDLRSRLPRAPPAALVGVMVQPGPGPAAAEQEQRAALEALLCESFHGARPGLQEAVQAAAYSPGRPEGPLEVRRAACRALRAALKHRPGGEERDRRRLPSVLRCIPWGRRSWRRGCSANAANNVHEGGLQHPDEGVALTSMSPNGNCEETGGGPGAQSCWQAPAETAAGLR
ncbi:uncharacterized protein C2orf72 homolog [Emydura macquarii macquarii]|uniref:uncharacterized protein C2orf72 homolog n=1 Tax=Emydura macquarii macquarii TaxID=1129001 RepID=UPI00352A9CEF